jgi:hypothetical protein
VTAHAGGARTGLLRNMPPVIHTIAMWYAQPAAGGALPALRAAVDPGGPGRRLLRPRVAV